MNQILPAQEEIIFLWSFLFPFFLSKRVEKGYQPPGLPGLAWWLLLSRTARGVLCSAGSAGLCDSDTKMLLNPYLVWFFFPSNIQLSVTVGSVLSVVIQPHSKTCSSCVLSYMEICVSTRKETVNSVQRQCAILQSTSITQQSSSGGDEWPTRGLICHSASQYQKSHQTREWQACGRGD